MFHKLLSLSLLKYLTITSAVIGGTVITVKAFNHKSVVSNPVKTVKVEQPAQPEPRVFKAYKITDVTLHDERLNTDRIILINSAIGDMSAQINQLQSMSEDSDEPIYVAIDSPGGSVMGGTEFITAMKAVKKAPVITICLNLCASMAFVIHQYGTQRWVTDHAILMSHPASIGGSMGGEVDKVINGLMIIQRYVEKHNMAIAKRAKMNYEEFKARSSVEMWLMSDEALATGFADKAVALSYQKEERKMEPSEEKMYQRIEAIFNAN
jgi:ATP-dependent Clp protease, protease subunit